MILSDRDIKKALEEGNLIITPAPELNQFSTSALDPRVGSGFWKYKNRKKGIRTSIDFDEITDSEEAFANLRDFLQEIPPDDRGLILLRRGEFILVETLEYIKLPPCGKLAARVEGRSSLARLGISVHMTAPVVHCGFKGRLHLEIINNGPFDLEIRPKKTRLCQLVFEMVQSEPSGPLDSYFTDQDDPAGRKGSSL